MYLFILYLFMLENVIYFSSLNLLGYHVISDSIIMFFRVILLNLIKKYFSITIFTDLIKFYFDF